MIVSTFYHLSRLSFFFFNDTATPEIYTLSLHDALPICDRRVVVHRRGAPRLELVVERRSTFTTHGRFRREKGGSSDHRQQDRKSTRLNSSHVEISYAVFCLKKKKTP